MRIILDSRPELDSLRVALNGALSLSATVELALENPVTIWWVEDGLLYDGQVRWMRIRASKSGEVCVTVLQPFSGGVELSNSVGVGDKRVPNINNLFGFTKEQLLALRADWDASLREAQF